MLLRTRRHEGCHFLILLIFEYERLTTVKQIIQYLPCLEAFGGASLYWIEIIADVPFFTICFTICLIAYFLRIVE